MTDRGGADGEPTPVAGLQPSELAEVIAELAGLAGHRVRDVVPLRDRDDLVLFLQEEAGDGGAAGRRALHLALGARRARICTTRRRLRREAFATGPRADRLRGALVGAELLALEQAPGERRCVLRFCHGTGAATLHVELFGNRGLWVLEGPDGIVELSRPARDLRRGEAYRPPTSPPPPATGPGRFAAPVDEAVDRFFTARDEASEARSRRAAVERVLAGRRRKLEGRIAGLIRQQEQIARAGELRRQADMILAHGHAVPRGAEELVVPDPDRPGAELRIPLDPSRPAIAQAEALYRRARRLERSQATARSRREQAERELEAVAAAERDLARGADPEVLAGRLDPGSGARRGRPRGPARSEGFRRYTAREGHPILVGRNDVENDRLALRVARGNDLWFHVGAGRAGSHVVVRLPRGRSASLETLLDAATLAVHFSKSRGEPLCEVVYTQAKHLRRPKGGAPGKVLVHQSRSLRVRLEPERLRRLLASADEK